MSGVLIVSGTDTGIGKTVVAAWPPRGAGRVLLEAGPGRGSRMVRTAIGRRAGRPGRAGPARSLSARPLPASPHLAAELTGASMPARQDPPDLPETARSSSRVRAA